jgi:hypothetical protein
MWRAADALAELPFAQAIPAEFRISCMRLRHEHDAFHDSRAWSPCCIASGGTCELRLCWRQQ